jgi:hypothetical protein
VNVKLRILDPLVQASAFVGAPFKEPKRPGGPIIKPLEGVTSQTCFPVLLQVIVIGETTSPYNEVFVIEIFLLMQVMVDGVIRISAFGEPETKQLPAVEGEQLLFREQGLHINNVAVKELFGSPQEDLLGKCEIIGGGGCW